MKKSILSYVIIILINSSLFAQLTVNHLRCEYKTDPLGIDMANPRLSWIIEADDSMKDILQTAFQIQVAIKKDDLINEAKLFWDSKKTQSDKSTHLVYKGKNIPSKTRVFWRVRVWDNHSRKSEWSKIAFWETGILDSTQWKADWIRPDLVEDNKKDNPAPFLRKKFNLRNEIKKAKLYITSKGLYHATINGQLVTNQVFNPGWTSFNKRLQYQIYDVTNLLVKGENAIGVILGDGWYRGRFGFGKEKRNHYGEKLALLYQLEIEYINGKKKMILSDKSWKSSTGPIVMSNIYDGEIYNGTLELNNWDKVGFNDNNWQRVVEENYSKGNIVSSIGEPVKRIQEIEAIKKIITPKNELVFDFGQNLVGRVKIQLKGIKNDTLTIYHAEVLDSDGNFYNQNLRSAKQKVQYVFKNNNEVIYEPFFTFQGFRYIKVEGYSGNLSTENFTAVVIHSDMEKTGNFECSDSLINQLQSNIIWGQKGNFLDVPTDCPQRDERMGWTGDAQAFASTAMFNFNTAAFYTKWMKDVDADQLPNGSIPFVIPDVIGGNGSTGWGDVVTILPYTMYQKYGDKRILEQHYHNMKGWVNYLHSLAGEDLLLDSSFHFGDWLFFIHPTYWNVKPGYTDIDLISTAFFAYSTKIVAKTARIIGKTEDELKYNKLFSSVSKKFQQEYMTSSGRLSSNSQTAYILALQFELLPNEYREKAFNYLVENIISRGYHLSTGFLGTPYLCHVLSKFGRADIAYKLLFRKEYPSWLYPVTKSATTIWERWDGIKPDGSFQDVQMNSFNHYAYGAIGDWIYSNVAGIQHDASNPGYKHIIIKPIIDTLMTYAKAQLNTPYGLIATNWKTEGKKFYFKATIPSNTKATIYLPYLDKIYEVGSGKYEFEYDFESIKTNQIK